MNKRIFGMLILLLVFCTVQAQVRGTVKGKKKTVTTTTDTKANTTAKGKLFGKGKKAQTNSQNVLKGDGRKRGRLLGGLWKRGGEGIVSFSHTNYARWEAGVLNNTTIVGNINLFADMEYNNWLWENDGRFILGFVMTEGITEWRKGDDVIDIDSKLGYKLSEKTYWSTLATFDSQFAPGRVFSMVDANQDSLLVSRFASPAIISLGTGVDYKAKSWLSLYFSPLTFRGVIVADDVIANIEGAAGGGLYGNKLGQNFKPELGARFTAKAEKELIKNISWTSMLDLYSNFLENSRGENKPQNIDILWVNNFGFKVNRFISATLETTLKYDDEIAVVKNRGENGERLGRGTQFKSFFGIGLTYKFGAKE